MRTIGDGYLAACGLGRAFGDKADARCHASRALAFACDSLSMVSQCTWGEGAERRKVRMRAGVHAGEVFSGVVGFMQPQYDLFGHPVNAAARLEQTAPVNTVQASTATVALARREARREAKLDSDYICPKFRYKRRPGVVEMKNMEPMATCLVSRVPFGDDEDGGDDGGEDGVGEGREGDGAEDERAEGE